MARATAPRGPSRVAALRLATLRSRHDSIGVPRALRGGAATTPFIVPDRYTVPHSVARKTHLLRPRRLVLRAVKALGRGELIAAVPLWRALRCAELADEAQSSFVPAAADVAAALGLDDDDDRAARQHAALTLHVAAALCGGPTNRCQRWIPALVEASEALDEAAGGEATVHLDNDRVVTTIAERMHRELVTRLEFGVVPPIAALAKAWRLVSCSAVELEPPPIQDAPHTAEVAAAPPPSLTLAPVLALMCNVAVASPNVTMEHARPREVLSLLPLGGALYADGGRQQLRRCRRSGSSSGDDGFLVLRLAREVERGEVLCVDGAHVPLPLKALGDVQFALGLR